MKNKNLIVLTANTSWYIYNFRLSLIKTLLNRDFRVVVLAPFDDYVVKLKDEGCDYYPLNINNKSINPITELKTIYNYYKAYSVLKPSIVLHFTPKPNIYGSIAARFLNINCISNIAGLGTAFNRNSLLKLIVKILYSFSQSKVNCVFFQNKDDMQMFINSGIARKEQANLLPGSGVELDRFYPVAKKQKDDISFLLIARLIWEKGIGDFAEAASIVKRSYPNTSFQLLGFIDNNNPNAVTIEQIRAWEEKNILKWVGRQEDVRQFIAESDCVVLPSYYKEGTPRTLLEASSMAKPIIAADTIGCREPVEDGINGFLCKPKNPKNLASKMTEIIEMSHEKRQSMGLNGREKMKNEYDVKIVINKYLNKINEADNNLVIDLAPIVIDDYRVDSILVGE